MSVTERLQPEPQPSSDEAEDETETFRKEEAVNNCPAAPIRPTRVERVEARVKQANTRTEQAEARTERAETRTEQAETRTELAKTRTEQAEIRIEQLETRTEQAEARTEEAETILQRLVNKKVGLNPEISPRFPKEIPPPEIAGRQSSLDELTHRQREILRLIAESQNTKQIAAILKVSPKTIEYHRKKLMDRLDIHDVPGLVRFAIHAGLLPQDKLIAG
jgi:DNA-binding CsgD family transcriptional regulator